MQNYVQLADGFERRNPIQQHTLGSEASQSVAIVTSARRGLAVMAGGIAALRVTWRAIGFVRGVAVAVLAVGGIRSFRGGDSTGAVEATHQHYCGGERSDESVGCKQHGLMVRRRMP